ncbi:LysM peptidoglycan-binding domain-containing protein [Fibrisoma montanum]|uniref:LysM peptidoglycan-binding domain-containing protein n=1 Tax=Fibrisoma montanum TaxID=2305895 RepID=A0A418LXS0_9BACT|nr:lytic transglycosylase domain-containing protein [Fibrisoma montanum]RIV18159.1 LysM peptidoglycan-binding domain-containing protein [Fibrisoma montanum]
MKKLVLTPLLFLVSLVTALAQIAAPPIPDRVTFADISVRLDDGARRIIQQDVNALLSNRQYWNAKLDRVVLYFPIIEAILVDEDVPTDFKYLAVQESSLTPDAVSSSMAVGFWQFKRETAMDHGLRVDDDVDERKSITASTRGAAKYIKKSNAQFNNWVASLYSYYLGAGGIAKLIPPDWSYAREITLDGRTDRYILRFFAHKLAIESALPTHRSANTIALLEYPNGGGRTIQSVAAELGVDANEIRKYNRWLAAEMIPNDKAYVMAIPVASNQINDVRQKIVSVSDKKTPDFVQNDVGFPVLRRVNIGQGSKNDPVLYEINGLPGIQAQAGDNVASLARKAKISLSSFLRYNDMSERDPVIVNDVYYLAKKRKKALVPFHNVREGETARSISQRYGIRLKKLMRYNRLDRVQKLAVGRVMWLRERRPASKPIEIINSPTPPVYDKTPTPAARPEVAMNNGASRPVTGSSNVPRNASERKVYQPKLVTGGISPDDQSPDSQPATVEQPTSTRTTPPPARTERPAEPAPSSRPSTGGFPSSTPTSSTSSRSTEPDGSQRIVIVRTPDAAPVTESSDATPNRTTTTSTPERPRPATTRPTTTAKATPTVPVQAQSDDTESPLAQIDKGKGVEQPPVTSTGTTNRPVTTRPADDVALNSPKTETRPAEPAPKTTTPVKPEPRPVSPSVTPTERPTVTPSTSTASSSGKHTVEAGQTYYSISKLYGLTVEELLSLNNLTVDDRLAVGQQLTVKLTPGGRIVQPSPSALQPKQAVIYHTVEKGETMFRISKQYNVTIEQIQEWNSLTDVGVKEGQKIKIMKPAE